MRTFSNKKSGFTLIELIVVISIIGSVMALGLKLLNSLWLKQSTGVTSLEMMQLLEKAREKALATGTIYSLTMNMEKRIMELHQYDPEYESRLSGVDTAIPEEDEGGEEKRKKAPEILFRSNIPYDIEEIYSASGLKLSTVLIFLHFYPDGSGDSIILKYKNRDKPFYYIPHNGSAGVYFSDFMSINHDFQNN